MDYLNRLRARWYSTDEDGGGSGDDAGDGDAGDAGDAGDDSGDGGDAGDAGSGDGDGSGDDAGDSGAPPAPLTAEQVAQIVKDQLAAVMPQQQTQQQGDGGDESDFDWKDPAGSFKKMAAQTMGSFAQDMSARQSAEASIMASIADCHPDAQAHVRQLLAMTPTNVLKEAGASEQAKIAAKGYEVVKGLKKVASTATTTPSTAKTPAGTTPAAQAKLVAQMEAQLPHLKGRIKPEMLQEAAALGGN